MQIEKITVQVRPRPAWEAVDLGFLMLQRWISNIAFSWLAVTLPIFLLLNYWFSDRPLLAAAIFWWLLPLFDRIPLDILSRAVFGEYDKKIPSLVYWLKLFMPGLLKSLTIHRFDSARSYSLPVSQLEKLSGKTRSERVTILKKAHYSNAIWLTITCFFMEIVVFMGLFGLLFMFTPDYYADQIADSMWDVNTVWWVGPLMNCFVYITYFVVEPFYVAGGFSLYINRRTQLEGWDIEIVFRQLAQRTRTISQIQLLAVGTFVVLGLATPFQSGVACAAEPERTNVLLQSPTTNQAAKKTIEGILATKEFEHTKEISGWYLKNTLDETRVENKGDRFNLFSLAWLGDILAFFGQISLWIAVAFFIAAAFYYYTKWKPAAAAARRSDLHQVLPKSLFGLDIRPQSLPNDITGAAMALFRTGKGIESLGLLYRGALTTLVYRDGISLSGSATEGECMRIVTSQDTKIAQPARRFFHRLTSQWQFAAYAHRLPDEISMADLCTCWAQHFGAMR